jgi:hypothetical protein
MLSLRKIFFVLVIIISLLSVVYSNKIVKTDDGTTIYTRPFDHAITLAEASQLTRNFRANAGPEAITGGFFRRESFLKILAQDGCVGIRLYYGLKDEKTTEIVMVGVDDNGRDLVNGHIAERIYLCPPFCDESNPLNSDLYSNK